MTSTLRTVVVLAIICCAVLAPGEAQAQQAMSARPYESLFAREVRENPVPQAAPRGSRAVMTGALIGAGGALALTAMAAAKYGENEGGSFCTRCMMQWSVVSVPIGAPVHSGGADLHAEIGGRGVRGAVLIASLAVAAPRTGPVSAPNSPAHRPAWAG
jgi:hypothetical protein